MHNSNEMNDCFCFILVLIFSVLIISCNKDYPKDRSYAIGQVHFSNSSLEAFFYNGSEKLIFANINGNEIELKSDDGLITDFHPVCVLFPCEAEGDRTCDYIEHEYREINLLYNSIIPDTNYAEVIHILYSDKSTNQRNFIKFMSSNREKLVPNLDSIFGTEFFETRTIISTSFDNVYTNRSEIFYSKTKGLIGFKLEDTLYELKRVE